MKNTLIVSMLTIVTGLSAGSAVAGNLVPTGYISQTECFADSPLSGAGGGNFYISGTDVKTNFVVNKNRINATCKFVDTSGIFEKNAETAKIESCTINTGTGLYLGTGQVTASSENASKATDDTGGNVTIKCAADAADIIQP